MNSSQCYAIRINNFCENRMAVKRCCVENCNSSSTRLEDIGVTYHKFPKDTTLRETWVSATHVHTNIDSYTYVCSRHFCKSDFQSYQDSKYMLKSGTYVCSSSSKFQYISC